MSRLRANQITNENANGAPNFPHGLTVTGIITATNTQTTFSNIVVGSAVTANSNGVDTVGIVTAGTLKDKAGGTFAPNPTTTQGDVIVRGASANERLAIGSAGQVLKVNSGANGLEYGVGGGITQVITDSDTTTGSLQLASQSTLYDYPNISVTITPASSSSKFLISFHLMGETDSGGAHAHSIVLERSISGGATTFLRGDDSTSRTGVFTQPLQSYYNSDDDSTPEYAICTGFLDSPGTASAITYKPKIQDHESTGYLYYNRCVSNNNDTSRERGISWMTVMEVVV